MKHALRLLLVGLLTVCMLQAHAQRYLTEIFTSFDSMANVAYAQNISVLTGSPMPTTLLMDVYMPPSSDPVAERPLVIIAHTGSFLPPVVNGQATGSRHDSTVVEMAKQFAKRGYVCALMSNRMGWNPVSPDQDTRTGTLINAAYRGIQDMRSCVRYFRKAAATMGNPYKIDPNMIIAGGVGTGGYISFGTACLDKSSEINLTKFISGTTGQPYVNPMINGNFDGTDSTALCRPNHVGYSSAVQFAFNLGGALGDSTWLEAGEVPMVGFHCPSDPFAPYDYGAVIVPTTGDFVVNVTGTKGVLRKANQLGNNDPIIAIAQGFTDPYTVRANAINGGYEGLFPFIRPMPTTPTTTCPDGNAYPNLPEGSPWDWWDENWYIAAVNSQQAGAGPTANCKAKLGNPDMSASKARKYIDSVMNYLNPRIFGTVISGVKEGVSKDLRMFPNPAKQQVVIKSANGYDLLAVEVLDITGRVVFREENIYNTEFVLKRNGLPAGTYFVRTLFKDGEGIGKLWFE